MNRDHRIGQMLCWSIIKLLRSLVKSTATVPSEEVCVHWQVFFGAVIHVRLHLYL